MKSLFSFSRGAEPAEARRRLWITVLAVALAIFSLPDSFFLCVANDLDSSWVRAINYAVKEHLVFGSQFVFTYGPLGYLSTRHTQYIPDIVLLLADVFVCGCYFYIVQKLLLRNRGWALLMIAAFFFCKGNEYSVILFLLFLVLSILNIQNRFRNYFEMLVCAICGVTVFFIKLNYGIVSLPVLVFLICIAFFQNRRSSLFFLACSFVFFFVLYSLVSVQLSGYIRYGLSVFLNYPDAMVMEIGPSDKLFVQALLLVGVFAGAVIFAFVRASKKGGSLVPFITGTLMLLMCFLMYKNGFTMLHTRWFFCMFPIVTVFALLLMNAGNAWWARLVALVVFAIAINNVGVPGYVRGENFLRTAIADPARGYFSRLFTKEYLMQDPNYQLPDSTLAVIGNATIDVMPTDISLLFQHGLNYCPRPLIQTYSAYSPLLDSLNAGHFRGTDKPGFVLAAYWSMQGKYTQWEESLTKCMLHLNYKVQSSVLLKNHTDTADAGANFLFLKSDAGSNRRPIFTKLYEQTINFNDTFRINDTGSTPLYMTADIDYTPAGKIMNLLFQPPVISVAFITDEENAGVQTKRVIRPLLKEPVLIGRLIRNTTDFRHFLSGEITQCPKIKGAVFHASRSGCKQPIHLTFCRFSNY